MRLLFGLFALAAHAQSLDVSRILSQVERHYNTPSTLEMRFEQSYRGAGQLARKESGLLFLRKPGRMRWEYRQPEGKLFLSDGKDVWFYSPAMHQAERSKLKASDDLRAPLAFLMGRLDFHRDFGEFQAAAEGDRVRVRAVPKSKNSPYRGVEFVVSPLSRLEEVSVTGQDGSRMTFRFSEERLNGAIEESRFRFVAPAGVEVVEVKEGSGN